MFLNTKALKWGNIVSGKTEVKSEGWFKISRAQKSFSFTSPRMIMTTNEPVKLLKVLLIKMSHLQKMRELPKKSEI